MSNIYIQEPPTSGKVLLQTSVGDIDIELWAKETPKASRNFIQLCLEGYYNGTIFHRLVKGFIVQGGDPNGDGTGGESIYDAPFKDEFHTRLRFSRRGLVAMANSGKDDNGSQFFFTLNATPELQNKHTIFGKVIGDTVYNMLKLEDGLVDDDEKPVYPHKILKTEVLINPFPDIVPRCIPAKVEKKEKKKKHDRSGVKDFKLLSFGEEAQEDEELTTVANEQFSGKSKSTHDLLKDPKLSTQPAIEDDVLIATVPTETEVHEAELETIRQKLKSKDYKKNTKSIKNTKSVTENVSIHEDEVEEEDEEQYYFGKDKADEQKKKMENIRKEIKQLKQSYHSDKLTKTQVEVETKKEEKKRNEMINEYEQEQEKYREAKKALPKKGTSREQYTLSLLKKFQEKLNSAKQKAEDENIPDNVHENDEEDDKDGLWLAHKLKFDSHVPVLARDANTKDDNWYEIDDPRNPLNKRRREDSKSSSKEKRHKR